MTLRTTVTNSAVAMFILITCGVPAAQADLAVSFTSVSDQFTNGSYSLGYNFIPTQTITVTALGDYNPQVGSHDVGIFDFATQALLKQTSVSSSDTRIGFFNYHTITPITLNAGHKYQIATVTGSDLYTNEGGVNGLVYSPIINVIDGGYVFTSSLTFFTNAPAANWFGPNFEFNTATVPEPSTLAIAGLSGALLLGYTWSRRQTCGVRSSQPKKKVSGIEERLYSINGPEIGS